MREDGKEDEKEIRKMKWENGNIRGAVVFLGTRIGSRNAQLRQSGGIKYLAPGEISFCLHCALPCPDYRRLAITTNELPVCVLLADNNCELDWWQKTMKQWQKRKKNDRAVPASTSLAGT